MYARFANSRRRSRMRWSGRIRNYSSRSRSGRRKNSRSRSGRNSRIGISMRNRSRISRSRSC